MREQVLSVGHGTLIGVDATTFRYCLDPTVGGECWQRAGASRFAFNQCLQMVKTAYTVAALAMVRCCGPG